jgi:hypothetical protein
VDSRRFNACINGLPLLSAAAAVSLFLVPWSLQINRLLLKLLLASFFYCVYFNNIIFIVRVKPGAVIL